MSFAAIAVFVGQLVSFLVLLLLAILLAPCLLLFRTSSGAPPTPPVLPQFPASPEAPLSGDWLLLVRMIVFWGLGVLVLLFITRTYWRDRQAAGMWRALREMLRAWWSALVAWFSGGARVVTRLLTRNTAAHDAKTPAGNASWWKRWQARTARERVRRLYLALVERAGEVGYARGRDQTPYEYSSRLESHVAGNEGALKELTEAFVAARYSRRDFDHVETSRLYRLWQNLRSALRRSQEIQNK
jgi:hypothetical protein